MKKVCSSGKRRYKSEDEALQYAEKSYEYGAPTLRTYQCGECLGWHLTKRLSKKKKYNLG